MSSQTDQPFQIAIDGPVAAGKSSIAKLLAEKLGLTYIDTGAMYRAVAYAAKQAGVDWHDEAAITKLAKKVEIRLARPVGDKKDGRSVSVYLNNQDISWEIRQLEYGEGASIIGTLPNLRKVLVKKQQDMCQGKKVVMEGRDIGSKVLPKADLKVFMIADQAERVRRKLAQLQVTDHDVSKKDVKQDVASRDEREMNRKIDPLKPTKDAWILDTTKLSMPEVIEAIINQVNQLIKSKSNKL